MEEEEDDNEHDDYDDDGTGDGDDDDEEEEEEEEEDYDAVDAGADDGANGPPARLLDNECRTWGRRMHSCD